MRLQQIKQGYCFTHPRASLVYYEDTDPSDVKKHYHSYNNGQLYRSKDEPCKHFSDDWYYCDVDGVEISLKTFDQITSLRAKNKELTHKKQFYKTENQQLKAELAELSAEQKIETMTNKHIDIAEAEIKRLNVIINYLEMRISDLQQAYNQNN